MRERFLKKLAHWHTDYPWRMLLAVLIVTLIFGVLSEQLSLTVRWSDLLPADDKRTIQFNKIIEEFVSSTSIVVVVQGEEKRIKKFADDLAPRLVASVDTSQNATLRKKIEELSIQNEQLGETTSDILRREEIRSQIKELHSKLNMKLIRRVDYKSEIDFLRKHGLMLIKEDDLRNINDVFKNPNLRELLYNINTAMEKEYVGQSESISTREKEDQAVIFLDGIENLVLLMQKYIKNEEVAPEEVYTFGDKLLYGEPYFLSYDKTTLLLNVIPNFTMMDTDLIVRGTDAVQAVVDKLLQNYPDVKAGLTGMIAVGRDEMVYSTQSLGYTSLIAVIAILILLIISLRMWVAPLMALFNLIVGIVWAIGITAVIVGQLNIMTQMMMVILLGLGIDFSIHLISGFTEWRAAGDSIADAMQKTFLKSGKGIITGAVTTACAFLTMMISSSRGMKEMGLVTGTGLIAILFTTFLFLPVMLVFRERRIERRLSQDKSKKSAVQRDISFRFLGKLAQRFHKRYIFTLLSSLVITLALIWSALRITFDHNYMNMEPEGLTSIGLQDTIIDKFDLGMDYALILTDDVEQSRAYARKYRQMGSVAITEDISIYLPSAEQQAQRIPYIKQVYQSMSESEIREKLSFVDRNDIPLQVQRLEMNVIEIQDMAYLGGQDKVDNKCKKIVGDPGVPESRNIIKELRQMLTFTKSENLTGLMQFQKLFAPYFKQSVLNMCSTAAIELEELPPSILDRYSNARRDQFLVTVFPAGNIWQDAAFLDRFCDDLERVTDRATGMPPVFRALVEIIGRDGQNAVFLTLIIVFFLLWIDYRSTRSALIAMIPLAIGLFWMVGLMQLSSMQITVMNIMGLPMILGIGIDDGVHIVHRWRIEGKGKINTIFSSTGKAILLTSLTTMLAFGSLIFSIWRGFGHLGGALFIGVAACFLTTLIILPGIIGLIERRGKK
jgi:predicted RND superfamily exporter protein